MALSQIAEAAMTALRTMDALASDARTEALHVGVAAAKRIAEATIHHVWDQLEPPSVDEGFVDIVEVGAVG